MMPLPTLLLAGLLLLALRMPGRAAPATLDASAAPNRPAAAAARPTRQARPASQVLADHARAIGGAAPFRKHKTMRIKRSRVIHGIGLEGSEELWATSTGKALQVMTMPGIGVFRQGNDGKSYWMQDPINGLRELEGAEQEQARIEATWGKEVKLPKLYERVRGVPPPEGADPQGECVELAPKLGKPVTVCFDPETHLRTLQQGVQSSPQGDIPFRATFDDWREVRGVKIPFVERLHAGPMSTEARVVEVAFDEPMPASLFKRPRPDRGDKTEQGGKSNETGEADEAAPQVAPGKK
jgi:zinc protease